MSPTPSDPEPATRDPAELGGWLAGSPAKAMTVVRFGLGIVWTLNLMFILDPANQFFSGFSSTAQSFAGTTLGGPSLANFAAANSGVFSVLIATTTAYLAAAFLLGASTRLACLVGLAFNASLLVTQFGGIVVIPGGTDVGPMPLYIVLYLGLLAAGGPTLLSVDRWWAARRRAAVARPASSTSSPSRPMGSDPHPMGGLGR